MKKVFIALSLVVFFTVSAAATSKIFKEHKPRMKNGVKVVKKCSYCHNSVTKLKKKGGQNIKLIQKTSTCSGKGCHGS